ncbi:hypothetical protein Emag_006765 [Eimeria magna]
MAGHQRIKPDHSLQQGAAVDDLRRMYGQLSFTRKHPSLLVFGLLPLQMLLLADEMPQSRGLGEWLVRLLHWRDVGVWELLVASAPAAAGAAAVAAVIAPALVAAFVAASAACEDAFDAL